MWCWIPSKTCSENTATLCVLCTCYWFRFDDFILHRQKIKTAIQFSFELCSLQKRIPCAGFVICTSPKPAWGAKNAWFWLERTKPAYTQKTTVWCQKCTKPAYTEKNQHFDTKSAQNLHILKKIKSFYSEKSPNLHILAQKTKNNNQFMYASQSHIESEIFYFFEYMQAWWVFTIKTFVFLHFCHQNVDFSWKRPRRVLSRKALSLKIKDCRKFCGSDGCL